MSNCCGTSAEGVEGAEETGICPTCHEHCEFECDHEWEKIDNSFDHEFGTEKVPVFERCVECDEERPYEDPRGYE